MEVSIQQATTELIKGLMQLYMYDFTAYLELEVDESGLYPAYPDLDKYFDRSLTNHRSYIIRHHEAIAGFALIDILDGERDADYYMAEFFVMKRHRRHQVGRQAAEKIFEAHPGRWLVSQLKTNLPATAFWRSVIHQSTQGQYEELAEPSARNITQRFKI
ncbi:putative acetyltransferase [Paenibacillus shirakamiensis]|uniref:Acetyltransferase n=1 Tax=Paenibacillus shirakamiensis TaxID=1265935 RepID=A0ABS4JDT7_9BACL|nr:GNAT family N-acetyltransferase [Paenibacillus shirakamiensis]MBP1999845.1 putative acetyltransferase [Paenibacillus shirakamiensis]